MRVFKYQSMSWSEEVGEESVVHNGVPLIMPSGACTQYVKMIFDKTVFIYSTTYTRDANSDQARIVFTHYSEKQR